MGAGDEGAGTRPRVVVLMATYNGRRWIDEQVDSVLTQVGVDVHLRISDDGSRDGTREHLVARAQADPRIEVLPPREGAPGVAANFLHLFATWAPTRDVHVALSDQDDVWHPDKLATQVARLRTLGVDAISSNVVSFDAHGHRHLIVKNRPQVRWDHVFEAAGPGSTYVFTPGMHARLVDALARLDTDGVGVHDWYLYALTRGLGGRWHIDAAPTVDYRQHEANVQGEHAGMGAFRSRFTHLRSGFYRAQFRLTADAVREVGSGNLPQGELADLDHLRRDLSDLGPRGRLAIARRHREIRRDQREGVELAAACLLGLW